MDPDSKRRLRRRIAGLILLIGGLAIGAHFFSLTGRVVTVEIHYQLGDPPVARSLDATIVRASSGETVATFRSEDPRPVVRQKVPLAPGSYRVVITLRGGAAATRDVTRSIEVKRGADITIDLRDEGPGAQSL